MPQPPGLNTKAWRPPHPALPSPRKTLTEGTTMKRTLAAMTALAALIALTACSSPNSNTGSNSNSSDSRSTSSATDSSSSAPSGSNDAAGTTGITITAAGQTFDGTLNDSDVSDDFVKTLPRTLSFDRNAGIEYITKLPQPMTGTGPFYTDVQPGDLVYYNPEDSITVIYEETSSVPTLTKMGKVTSNLAAYENLPDNVDLRIELK
jgi:hypothetical protein